MAKRSRKPQLSIFGGFRMPDKKSKGRRYIHKESYSYKGDAKKALKKRKEQKQNVIMRKYKANGRTYYGIYQRSGF